MATTDPTNVRIITTLGHVDHGKTTLMDALLAANNIISTRMAGKMRYLDSREDEQERGITMEASAVSLKFLVVEKDVEGDGRTTKNYVVNMIDTPGHVDFSIEVSTASRLCDGALVLVDVVEGVCTQTVAVLRQAWHDKLRPILVINKMDRLITELKLEPIEAYQHLARLIEDVNAVMGGFFASERMDDDLRWHEERKKRLAEKKAALADETDASVNEDAEFQEKDDEDIYFAPERGNVVFASAIDGWGFRVEKFAQLYAEKLKVKEANLRRVLWGDYYLDPKTKRFVLENIWAVYDAVVINPNPEKVIKIVTALNLKIPSRDLKSKDTRHLLSLIFGQWLSLSTCIIQSVIDIIPPPPVAQASRIPKMIHPEIHEAIPPPQNKLEEDMYTSNSGPEAYVSAYVSKMFAVPVKDLPENKKRPLTADEMRARAREVRLEREANGTPVVGVKSVEGTTIPLSQTPEEPPVEKNEDAEVVLGFARLYSGTIKVGSPLYAVLPKYNASLEPQSAYNAKYIIKVEVEGLYIMMGRELVAVESVKAGNIFAIKGLEGKVWRSATLCSIGEVNCGEGGGFSADRDCIINLGSVQRSGAPIVRVALEPTYPADMQKLVSGLKLLSQSDPCVETFQQQTGEHVILTAGELHLERCLKDLRERFARVEIQPSKPIVPFRETAIKVPELAPNKTPGAPRGTIKGTSSSGIVKFTIRSSPLPSVILTYILENIDILKRLQSDQQARERGKSVAEDEDRVAAKSYGDVVRKPTVTPDKFWEMLQEKCQAAGGEWEGIVDRIWAFGPLRAGGCLLVDSRKTVGSAPTTSLKRKLDKRRGVEAAATVAEAEDQRVARDFDNHIEAGFQLATFQGPLCAEPVEGMAYFVEEVELDKEALEKEKEQNRVAQVTGSTITAVKDACRNGLVDWSPRLMLAMYTCDIQASTDVLGKVYGVIAKRRGRITAEEMKEGTTFFNVSALLPVVESFGFADDIRKKTSGAASPQLIFSGYELLDLDPFWVPTTEEELEDLGEKADKVNVAKVYMDAVRERKGMFVDRKIVEFAEKQRTLKK